MSGVNKSRQNKHKYCHSSSVEDRVTRYITYSTHASYTAIHEYDLIAMATPFDILDLYAMQQAASPNKKSVIWRCA